MQTCPDCGQYFERICIDCMNKNLSPEEICKIVDEIDDPELYTDFTPLEELEYNYEDEDDS